MSSLLHFLT